MELEKIKTLKDFVDASIKITHKTKDYFEPFLFKRIKRLGFDGGLQEFYNPLYNEYDGNFRYRLIVFNLESDRVGVIFKYVLIHTTKYICIVDYPISLFDYENNESLVYNYLVKNNIIKKRLVVVPNISTKYIDQNFYNIVPERWYYINRSKWRTPRGINVVLKDPNFKIKVLESSDFTNVYKTFKMWGDYKPNLDPRDIKKKLTNILEFVKLGEASGLCLYYKEALVGFSIWVSSLNGGYITHIRNVNLMRVPGDVIEREFNVVLGSSFKRVQKDLGSVMHYYLIKHLYELRGLVFYVGGAGNDTHKILPENKIKDNAYEIKYDIVECKESDK